ncbi:hypothetical protein scyTo_0013696, partial [Scyliorhinus torazame]|nr:hypothetical protein [Scyliorhinus torazame]
MLSKPVLLSQEAINMYKASEQASSEYAEFVATEKGAKTGNEVNTIDVMSQYSISAECYFTDDITSIM